GMISGCNFGSGRKRDEFSYGFSRYNYIWGWASWRRAWKNYDVKMGLWPEIKAGNWLKDIFEKPKYAEYWTEKFDATYDGKINTWDYQWFFTCLINNFLTIIPGVNLVSNIGFSSEATHTAGNPNDAAANIQTFPMKFPVKHPPFVIRNSIIDTFVQNKFFVKPGVMEVLNHNIKTSVKKLLNIKK
ncbi:MAG TPA: glycosyltransferase family 2 protein, partial [Candidatus Wallbacteria bacterium]|nr:glycosyltransferase family 2 protein [Candidatus Wallbacteria bacterium]